MSKPTIIVTGASQGLGAATASIAAASGAQVILVARSKAALDLLAQEIIRLKGKGKTPDSVYQYFLDLLELGQLLPPEKPARAAVSLALGAPHAWSGEILQWDEERVQALGTPLKISA